MLRLRFNGRPSLDVAPIEVEFGVALPRERLTLRELVDTARTVDDPNTAQTALLRLAAAAIGLCCPEIGKAVADDRKATFARSGYSAMAYGGPVYEWLSGDRNITDVEIIEQGMVAMRIVIDTTNGWTAAREAVNAAKKDSAAPKEPGIAAPTP